ncbi:putative transposase A [Pseudomonas fluorescens Q8r1-96]|nr:putative transposase A [Pseudomonas fluorescens Q8r1-96]
MKTFKTILNGVLWGLCSSAACRDMPERFGPWSMVYQRFRSPAPPRLLELLQRQR